jgi:hypothetical protein
VRGLRPIELGLLAALVELALLFLISRGHGGR